MIAGLENLLADTGQAGLPELRRCLADMFDAERRHGRIVEVSKLLRSRVFRVAIELDATVQSVVIKRLSPELAYRERRLLERWLPRIDMDGYGPPLLGSVAEQSGHCVWHVYEDLGPWTLDQHLDDDGSVLAATRLVSSLHQRAANHAVLAECRASGGEFGSSFYASSVRDAMRNLAALESDARMAQPKNRRLVDKLQDRLQSLWRQRAERAELMAQYGGPETIVHGDLWTTNIFVVPGERLRARLIDWDHVGVGQVAYDLSTYLLRFPAARRHGVLNCYAAEAGQQDWVVPPVDTFNRLCETAEYARLANAIVWSAVSVHEDPTEWAFAELAEIDQWFDDLTPILPARESLDRAAGSL